MFEVGADQQAGADGVGRGHGERFAVQILQVPQRAVLAYQQDAAQGTFVPAAAVGAFGSDAGW
jgi:hypothetical protein